jgi:hypothetical protein
MEYYIVYTRLKASNRRSRGRGGGCKSIRDEKENYIKYIQVYDTFSFCKIRKVRE